MTTRARNLLVILATLALAGGLATWAWELYADSVGMSLVLLSFGSLVLADHLRPRDVTIVTVDEVFDVTGNPYVLPGCNCGRRRAGRLPS